MFRITLNRIAFASAILLLLLGIACNASAGESEQQVCDVGADYSLGIGDYSEAIRRHVDVVRKHPDNALAHYHLGFAMGMIGDRTAEITEYQRAEELGLRSWDLFLNLGLAELESGELDAASDSLRSAVLLGENHSESHFTLAVVEQRRGTAGSVQQSVFVDVRFRWVFWVACRASKAPRARVIFP